MSLKIVPSARQPFVGGSRVVFSMEGDNSCSDRVRSENVPLERRKCHWKAIRLSGPPEVPTGFEVPSCFEPTVMVEFPVEPGEWLLMATNSRRESFSLRYSVGGFPVKANPKKPVKFQDLDPKVVLGRMRVASSGLERIESKFRCKPEVAEHTAVASNHPSIDQELSRDSLKSSIQNLDALLAKSRGERRWALRVILTPGGAANLGKAKARQLHVFASCINGIWALTDWTSLGRAGASTIYARPSRKGDEIHGTQTKADILADLEDAVAIWHSKWPYQEGYVSIQGRVDDLDFAGGFHAETPGKDAAKQAAFLDALSMVALFVGLAVPAVMALRAAAMLATSARAAMVAANLSKGALMASMAAGAGASAVRINESVKQGKGVEDNVLDVLFLVATATTVGKMAVGSASGMSRVASVATQVKGKSITYMTWADDLANGACFVMMTPEVYDLTMKTLSDDSLTASQKLERLATGLMPYVVTGGILIHNVGGKRLVDFGKRVLDETMTIRPTELLPLEAHTNERTNKTQVGRGKKEVKPERPVNDPGMQADQGAPLVKEELFNLRSRKNFEELMERPLDPNHRMEEIWKGKPQIDAHGNQVHPVLDEQTLMNMEVNGTKPKRIRMGTNGKVAVIGIGMEGNGSTICGVRDFSNALREKGVDTFLYAGTNLSESVNREWRLLKIKYGVAQKGRIPNVTLFDTLGHRENAAWAQKLIDEGYTVIDIGNPAGRPESVFYNSECEIIFGGVYE